MTNKPMFSVERELLEDALALAIMNKNVKVWDRLRALLDKPEERLARPVAFKFTREGHRVVLLENNSPECHFSDPENWHCTPLYAEQPAPVAEGTTSDKYKAELYDEVWKLARSMGFNNVTDALNCRAAPVAVVMPERRTFNQHDFVEDRAAAHGYNKALDDVARLNKVKS